MISLETTRTKLFDLLTGKNFDITTRDAQGKETTDPKTADLYSFEYKADGKTYGNVVITVGAKGEMEVFYGDMLGKGMDAEHKGECRLCGGRNHTLSITSCGDARTHRLLKRGEE